MNDAEIEHGKLWRFSACSGDWNVGHCLDEINALQSAICNSLLLVPTWQAKSIFPSLAVSPLLLITDISYLVPHPLLMPLLMEFWVMGFIAKKLFKVMDTYKRVLVHFGCRIPHFDASGLVSQRSVSRVHRISGTASRLQLGPGFESCICSVRMCVCTWSLHICIVWRSIRRIN